MDQNEILETLDKYEPKSMQNSLPVVWKKAKNEFVWDANGKKYIDFTSTIFVSNVGHANKRVKKYIKRQLNKNLMHTYTFAHESRAKFLKKLIEMTPKFCEKAFLLSSGTETTEAAIKLMRWYTGKNIIVSFKGAMHGRTMAAELMKGIGSHKDFVQLDLPNDSSDFLKDIKNINANNIAGFMIETYQGWSAKFLPKEYVQKIRFFSKDYDCLMCFDEVQAGFGRTGKLFGYEHYNVEPDLICFGKAIGGGLPLSGVVGRKEILDIPGTGDMSSTHSANPLCCAAGLAVLEELEDKFIFDWGFDIDFRSGVLESKLIEMQLSSPIIKSINCTGMIAGIIFDNEEIATKVCNKCLDKELILVHTGRESVKIGPPLTISYNNLWKGLLILEGVLNDRWN